MIAAEKAQGNRYLEGLGHSVLARAHRMRGDLAAAAAEAEAASELLEPVPVDHALALVELAAVRLAEGKAAEAVAIAREPYRRVVATPGYSEPGVRLCYAEALLAAGEAAEGRVVLAEARRRLLERAERITDPALHASFLSRVPENARTFALAARVLDDPPRVP
jgi:hypothetical protein